ncbi:MAG: 3-deoxy-7-phosphoheptulonate synthase, partial [Acidobacteriota bacterium]
MIVVLKSDASSRQVESLERLIRDKGCEPRRITGAEQSVIAVIGEPRFDPRELENSPA